MPTWDHLTNPILAYFRNQGFVWGTQIYSGGPRIDFFDTLSTERVSKKSILGPPLYINDVPQTKPWFRNIPHLWLFEFFLQIVSYYRNVMKLVATRLKSHSNLPLIRPPRKVWPLIRPFQTEVTSDQRRSKFIVRSKYAGSHLWSDKFQTELTSDQTSVRPLSRRVADHFPN